ncbi:MAG: hypothetical protein J0I70_09280 [Microbacterium sp.]|uniref:hypothetical protein n=1 Tax=Microbacterium sp. TaxID=51671 RepID=UPI001AD0B64F|nr:hypothetical protein [Microbacterium sp.]MBN9174327.1 hypothetical protein [Microbacterium sp.]
MTQLRMAPRTADATSVWTAPIARRDRTSAGAFIAVLLAPLDVPSRETVVARVRDLVALGPDARVGRTLVADSWRYDPSRHGDQSERLVIDAPDAALSLGAAPTLRDSMDPDLPFTVFLGGTRAAVVIDHRLGDGFLAVLLTAAVLGEGGIPPSISAAVDRDPLPAALRTTFAADRRRAADVLRDRVVDRRSAALPFPPAGRSRDAAMQPHPATVACEMSPEDTAAFQRWVKGRMPLAVAVLHAMREALPRSGIAATDGGSVLVDLRRYLPSGMSVLGNFVTGQPVALGADPDETADRLARLLRTGRPLAAHATGLATQAARDLRHRLRRPGTAATPVPTGVARLTVSDMGFVRPLDHLPWDDASGPATISVSVDAAGRDGMTVLTHVVRRRLNVSITFDAAVFDAARVAEACRQLCADPLGLLERRPA